MKNRRTTLGLLAAVLLVLALAATVIGASPSMRWRLVGSGGGPVQGSGYALASAIGQPLAGKSSNNYTLYSGLYLESFAPAPKEYYALLPAVLNKPCVGMPTLVESEPNDTPGTADGPLCPKVIYSGSPDSHIGARDDDWFKFYWSGTGTITIDLDNFLTAGQLLLYFDPDAQYLEREYDQIDRHYTITYTGTGQAGTYYIMVFAPAHTPGGGNYTLTFN